MSLSEIEVLLGWGREGIEGMNGDGKKEKKREIEGEKLRVNQDGW